MTDTTDNPESSSLMESLPLEERQRLFRLLSEMELDVVEGEKWSYEKILQFAMERDKRRKEREKMIAAGSKEQFPPEVPLWRRRSSGE